MLNFPNQTLTELVIPGSHDSFAYEFDLSKPCDKPSGIPTCFNSWILPWSQTQDLTLNEQLYAGIRYFDIRIIKVENQYYTIHCLVSTLINDLITEFKLFIDSHPSEILIVDINHMYNMEPEDKIECKRVITEMFNGYLIDSSRLNRPLNELRGNIWLIFDNHYLIHSMWHDKNDFNELRTSITNQHPVSGMLNVTQLILTPQTEDVAKGIIFKPCCCGIVPKSLRQLNYQIDPNFINEIIGSVNIIITDFIADNFVEICVQENNRRFGRQPIAATTEQTETTEQPQTETTEQTTTEQPKTEPQTETTTEQPQTEQPEQKN